MRNFEKAYSVIYLLAEWCAVRFFLAPGSRVADLLAIAGLAVVITSVMKKRYSLARMASIGYIVGWLISYLFMEKFPSASETVWVIAYILLILLGAYVEKKRRKAAEMRKKGGR